MTRIKFKPKRRYGNLFYSIILLAMLILFNGCTGKGDLRFNPLPDSSHFTLSGQLKLAEIVETDLSGSLRAILGTISDFSVFMVSAGGVSSRSDKSGSFTLSKVPFSEDLAVRAEAGKIALMRRVSSDELYYSDLSKLELNLQTTAEALIWQQGLELDKNLTAADIRAREYETLVSDVVTAIKLCLQLPKTAVPQTILELAAVKNAASSAASQILERETQIREANSVLRHILLRSDIELLKVYISPSFSNDWDTASTWNDVIGHYTDLFKDFSFTEVSWLIMDSEFLPNDLVRVRTEAKIKLKNLHTEEIVRDKTYTFDAMWRKEGNFWKVYRNMPYRDTHPSEVHAGSKWGEIADAHRELQAALATEKLDVISSRISQNFGNDWDVTSTYADLASCTQNRFNAMDVKIANYSVDSIDFYETDRAKVKCSAQVKVISLLPGVDIDSGPIKAVVEWRRENGTWKIYRNLPYRFSHPTNIE
ncbi:MAG: hypothetical protein ACD_39C01777G0003 [uncultured bacterium]|nr:MAG: hypothetical protein ACD_39C01777G0003 [uncultured bacterium]